MLLLSFLFFFFNDTATTEIYTLSLHDALPIYLLATLLAPSRGGARVAGYDVARDGLAVRRRIGLVFQETTLDRDLTLEENLRFAAPSVEPELAEQSVEIGRAHV